MTTPQVVPALTPTEAGLLGLLAIEDWPRPWTSYELAKQAGRSLAWFWPRASRQFIRLPRRLVDLGYAQAHDHPTGRRAGTRYAITESGQAALREWLAVPSGSITFEGENIIRVFFADAADVAQLRQTLKHISAAMGADQARLAAIAARQEVAADSPRTDVNALSIRLVADLQATVQRWTQWALEETSGWEDPRQPWPRAEEIVAEVIAAGDAEDMEPDSVRK